VGLLEGYGHEVKGQNVMKNGRLIGASHLRSWKEPLAMLHLAAEKEIESWVEGFEITAEGLKTA